MTGEIAAPFRIITTADGEASSPKQWVVRGLFGAGEVSGLVAPPTVGKSALALDLAASIAAGSEWFGRGVAAGAALYFAPERGAVTVRRLRAFETYHELRHLPVGVVRDRLDLMGPRDADRMLAAVKTFEDRSGLPVRLITVDTARAAMPGGDENSPRDMGALAQNLGRVRDGAPGAHVQLIHHTPKGRPAEASGHTSLAAMLDAVVVVSVDKRGRSWVIAEANDLPATPARAFFELRSVTIGTDGSGSPMTAPVVVPEDAAEETAVAAGGRLPKDTELAYEALKGLANGTGATGVEEWRQAAYAAFNGRKPRDGDAQRQAFATARRRLTDQGLIAIDGDAVSVRMREEA